MKDHCVPLHAMRLLARWCAERADARSVPVVLTTTHGAGGCLVLLRTLPSPERAP